MLFLRSWALVLDKNTLSILIVDGRHWTKFFVPLLCPSPWFLGSIFPPFHCRDAGTFMFTTALFTITKTHNSDDHPQMDAPGRWHKYTVHRVSCEEKQNHATCRAMSRIRSHYVKGISQIQKDKSYAFSDTGVRFQCISGGTDSTGDES